MTEIKTTYQTITDDCFSELSATLDLLEQETSDISLAESVQEAKAELTYLQYYYGLVDN